MRREPGGYSLVTTWVLDAINTLKTPSEMQVLLELAVRPNRKTPMPILGVAELHKLTKLDVRTIQRALNVLGALKFIRKERGLYCLVDTIFTQEQLEMAHRNAETMPSRFISAHIRSAVFSRDGYACTYCNGEEDLSLDHIQPWSRGGLHTLENLVVACRSCNSSKRARTPDEWAAASVAN